MDAFQGKYFGREVGKNPELLKTIKLRGKNIEFRKSGEINEYVKLDKNGSIVRGKDGWALYLSPVEVRAKGLAEKDQTITMFFEGKPIGFVSNEFGAVGIFLDPKGPRRFKGDSLGAELLAEFIKQNPGMKLGQMTPSGEKLARAVHKKLSLERKGTSLIENLFPKGPVAQASILGPILKLFDDAPWSVIKGERGSVKNPFVRMADEGQEIPLEVRQYVQTEGRVYDIASRLSINWDRINTSKDVKGTWAGARSVAADEIEAAAGEVRKLEDVADEAKVALAADPAGELARLQKIKAELGFSDVDLTEMRILETASAIELTQLKTLVLDNFPGAGEKLKAHWARHVMIMSQRQAMSATSSRIFGAGRIVTTGEEVGERAIADAVQNMADVAPTDIDANQLAIWLDALETPEQLTEMARIAAAPGFRKMLLEAWIAGLLTSPKTHLVNGISNTLMQLNHNFVDRPMAAAIGVFRTGGG